MTLQKASLTESLETAAAPGKLAPETIDGGIDLGCRSFGKDFVLTPELEALSTRALRYLNANIPVHFRGLAGCGKTALALFLGNEIGRTVYFLNGDATRTTDNLIGRETGVKTRQVIDRYVHSVQKLEHETSINWQADVLTKAALGGGTLIYDEFTRSPAEANNALLSVLEEGIIVLPASAGKGSFAQVHPDFRIIFTSNSAEYAGVQAAQDALIDRMITLDLDDLSAETEVAIVIHRTELHPDEALKIVSLVRDFRRSGAFTQSPSMRASLLIAQIAAHNDLPVSADDQAFVDLVFDVLLSKGIRPAERDGQDKLKSALFGLINAHCGPNLTMKKKRA
ncbi:MAG: gas vesicle protein GvpN [Pseudomonadota bacterium]